MKQDVRLYINDSLVDFSNELSMPFVYQLEDTNNPTILKNSFTKTISIPGTKNNNKIFGEIYNFDREQLYNESYLTGVYFNPSYRTPFSIYKNGELIESGYMQLNSISIKNKTINYEITLYGGIGDFCYSLMFNEENEPLKLSDLIYGVIDDDGNTINPENEFDFLINKEIIRKCWENIGGSNDNRFENFITFVPAYNGLYDDFDNNKVLVNTSGSSLFETYINDDNVVYRPYSGYAMCELNADYTEYDMRSLRSYGQRPALKVSKFFETISNPINNGGYNVELTETFFNNGNHFYNNAYITLPLLTSQVESNDENEEGNKAEAATELVNVLSLGSTSAVTTESPIISLNTDIISNNADNTINLVDLPTSTIAQGYVDIQLEFVPVEGEADGYDDLYLSAKHIMSQKDGAYKVTTEYNRNFIVQLLCYNQDNQLISYGKPYAFGNTEFQSRTLYNYNPPTSETPISVLGHFVRMDNDTFYFISDEGGNTFRIPIDNIPVQNNIRYVLYFERTVPNNMKAANNYGNYMFYSSNFTTDSFTYDVIYGVTEIKEYEGKIEMTWVDGNIQSYPKITKQQLLKTEKTPADYLLSYCKLFGLMFDKDVQNKTIYIRQRHTYFTNEIVDWTNKIDWNKDMTIKPIIFDYKFYTMKSEGENYYLDKYRKSYNIEYGQKRINTAYNFNGDSKDLLDNNVFQNAITVSDTSVYYRSFFKDDISLPPFLVEGCTYSLFRSSGSEIQSSSIEIKDDYTEVVGWNKNSGYDMFPKTCFYNYDGDKKTLADISSCLLFYDGDQYPKDINETTVNFWVTDDIPEMNILNGGKSCHIYTETAFDGNNNYIAYPINRIPQFTRYIFNGDYVEDSLDFAVPKEVYIPNVVYVSSSTIYDKFWDSFYNDQLNINTKKVTCYVNLNNVNVNGELLRKFYYFNNSLWLLNKIDNYDINSNETTKCEFIKINDPANYLKKPDTGEYFGANNNYIITDYKAGVKKVKIQSSTKWDVYWYNTTKITSITPMSGESGTTELTINYTENEDLSYQNFYLSLVNDDSQRITVEFKQMPNPETVVKVSGLLKYSDGELLPVGRILITDTGGTIVYDSSYADDYTGEYSLYAPKDELVRIEIQANILYGGDMIYETTMTFTEDTVRNFSIEK